MNIIDRRLNPKSKSLGNRQRFIRKAKADVKEAVKRALKDRTLKDAGAGENVTIKPKAIREPVFSADRKNSGSHDYVVPGNKHHKKGDKIGKPQGGAGGRGNEGSADGDGNDDFQFQLTQEEFLDVFMEDLKLPNLVKTQLKKTKVTTIQRAGFTTEGPPSAMNYTRTMRRSLGRRIALGRPSQKQLDDIKAQLEKAKQTDDVDLIAQLELSIKAMEKKRLNVSYVDPIDLQYNRFEKKIKPTTQAVMFCLMDVSGSMGEHEKDLAKRFFLLLHIFLSRHYKDVDVVFIRHTQDAQEVDEHTFFHDTHTGGTIVSSALQLMADIIKKRYSPEDWNIYCAQASDGDNYSSDNATCVDLIENTLKPIIQYFAYIQVTQPGGRSWGPSTLMQAYKDLVSSHFAVKEVDAPERIYPVFHELFSGGDKK